MSQQVDVIEHCRSAIEELLQEHVRYPLFTMREEDFRSSLLQKLRARIKGHVRIRLKKDKDSTPLKILRTHRERATTSRVHSEIRLLEKKKKNNKSRSTFDIVVLKDKPVALRVKQSATDVLERLEPEDVAVVIEIKAAPSNIQHKKIKDDISKLKGLRHTRPDLWRILVVIDKSLPLGVASYGKKPNWKWLESSVATRAKRGDVEVWFLDKSEKVCRRVFK